jgi:hypothetical protein
MYAHLKVLASRNLYYYQFVKLHEVCLLIYNNENKEICSLTYVFIAEMHSWIAKYIRVKHIDFV